MSTELGLAQREREREREREGDRERERERDCIRKGHHYIKYIVKFKGHLCKWAHLGFGRVQPHDHC